jgi:O-antigen ligase
VNNNSETNSRDRHSLLEVLASLSCLITVFAQMIPSLSAAVLLLWGITFLLSLASCHGNVRISGTAAVILGLTLIFVLICLICCLLTGNFAYLSTFALSILKVMGMYLIGYTLAFSKLSVRGWNRASAIYVCSAVVYAIWAFANYFPGFSAWLSSMSYLFSSKNSFGQIAMVGSIIATCVFAAGKSKTVKAVAILLAAFLFLSALFMQCRTAVLGYCCAAIALIGMAKKKWPMVVLILLAALLLLVVPQFQNYLVHALFLDKYSGADANAVSSGRLGLWSDAIGIIRSNPLVGQPPYYVDDFYLNCLANFGLIGALVVFSILFVRVIMNFRHFKNHLMSSSWISPALVCMTIFYLIESLLEGYPPFGPGTCAFMFWMLGGYVDGLSLLTDSFERR